MDVEYNEHKFRKLLILVSGRLLGDRAGGATKLNKVLFFADFAQSGGRAPRSPARTTRS